MRCYNTQHPLYCGIDLHAHAMYVCILNQAGETLLHRNMTTNPEAFLHAIAPYREGLVVAVACLFPWYGLADLCADAGIPLVLGHALSMQAIQGGKAKHDQLDSRTIAVLLRGGMLPQADVSPAARRATRDLLRRRLPLAHNRGALLAHVQHTTSQYTLPALGKKSAYQAHRDGVAERCAEPAVHKRIAVDLARSGYSAALRRDVALTIRTTAKQHAPNTLYLLQTVPGSGKLLSLVRLDERHQIDRCPRVQALASSCRLGTCAKEANGKRAGTSGSKLGHAHLQGAFAAAAVFCRRDNPAGQQCLSRLAPNHAKGPAWTSLAHT